jgi:hypothetical protein
MLVGVGINEHAHKFSMMVLLVTLVMDLKTALVEPSDEVVYELVDLRDCFDDDISLILELLCEFFCS